VEVTILSFLISIPVSGRPALCEVWPQHFSRSTGFQKAVACKSHGDAFGLVEKLPVTTGDRSRFG
jgi:hypothetical protein